MAMGDADLGNEYGGVLGWPTTCLIDCDGKVVKRIKDLKEVEAVMEKILDWE